MTRENGLLKLSSRRLLLLIHHSFPEDGAFWTAMRDGDWGDDKKFRVWVLNEIRLMRADYATTHGHKMKANTVRSPGETKAAEKDFQEKENIRLKISSQFHRGE